MRFTSIAAAVVVLAAGWAGNLVLSPSQPAIGASTPGQPAALVTDAVPLPQHTAVFPLPASTALRLTLVVSSRDPTGLAAFDRAAITAGSPGYRHFLSEAEFEQRFGPEPGAVPQVLSYLRSLGARSLEVSADGFSVSMTLDSPAVAQLLGAPIVQYVSSSGAIAYTPETTPTLPLALRPDVAAIDGLSSHPGRPVPLASEIVRGQLATRTAQPGQFILAGNTGVKWYIGSDYAQAYGVTGLLPPSPTTNASFATHEAIATILLSGYNATTGDLPPYDPRAVNQYFNDTFPITWPRPTIVGVPVPVMGVIPPPPGALTGGNDTTFDQVENSLDLEMAGSMAPGATVVNFYYAASLFDSATSQGLATAADDFASCLAAALAYNYGSTQLVAVTNSYGITDLNDSLWNTELLHAAAMGVTIVAASGDQGNAPPQFTGRFQGQWPVWPASAAFSSSGAIAVGGTSVDLGGTGTGSYAPGNLPIAYDRNVSGIVSEAAWYNTLSGLGNYSGSEGGASTVYPEPPFQFASAAQSPIVNATVVQGLSTLARSEPDVAFASNATVIYLSKNLAGVTFAVVEGTSIASPLLAGMVAEWVAVGGHSFGFLDPELYRIASYFYQHPGPTDPFNDIVLGANFLFTAARGWDAVTGWGSMNASRFLPADSDPAIAQYVWTGPTPGLPSHAPPGSFLPPTVLLAIGFGLAIATAVVLFFGRPRRRAGSSFTVPPGASGPTGAATGPPPPSGGGYPPPPPRPSSATFLCPYCGNVRPAEPVRCPSCGAY